MGDCVCAPMHKVRTHFTLSGNLTMFWVAKMAVSGVRQFTVILCSVITVGVFLFNLYQCDKDVNTPVTMITE